MARDIDSSSGSYMGLFFGLVLAAGTGYWVWNWIKAEAEAPKPMPVVAAPPAVAPQAVTPPGPQPEPYVTLQSTDGRTINAHVLVISDTSVFIRRDDGQKFDLPFDRLTPESRQRVMDARTKKIFGVR